MFGLHGYLRWRCCLKCLLSTHSYPHRGQVYIRPEQIIPLRITLRLAYACFLSRKQKLVWKKIQFQDPTLYSTLGERGSRRMLKARAKTGYML